MKKIIRFVSAIVLALCSSGILAVAPVWAKPKDNRQVGLAANQNHGRGRNKVTLCHLQRDDDKTKPRTITIAAPAVAAHLAHGDTLGACQKRHDDDHEDENENNDHGTAPVITNVSVAAITSSSAVVSWTTNEPSTSQVAYAASSTSGWIIKKEIKNPALVTAHALTLTGLSAVTTYRFRVASVDVDKKKSMSKYQVFMTLSAPSPDTTAPVITGVVATSTTPTSTRIQWATDEPSTSVVEYAAGPLATTTPLLTASNSTLVSAHSQLLSGLMASTSYYFRVKSTDASSNTATSTEMTFATPVAPDTTGPIITGVHATSTATTSTVIQWSTNEPSTSRVTFATQTLGTATVIWSILSNTLMSSHSLPINGLTAATQYFFVVASVDASGNTTTSAEQTFTTLP